MTDIISRTAAIEAMRECWRRVRKFAKPFEANRIMDCIKAVKELPAVDAVPVVHGRWIDENPDVSLDPRMRCSICEDIESPLIKWHYCPNCGAKMDMKG